MKIRKEIVKRKLQQHIFKLYYILVKRMESFLTFFVEDIFISFILPKE